MRWAAVGAEAHAGANQNAGAQKPKSDEHDDKTEDTDPSEVTSAATSASCSVRELTSNTQNRVPVADSHCPLHAQKCVSVNGLEHVCCKL